MAGSISEAGDPINLVYSTPPPVHCPPDPLLFPFPLGVVSYDCSQVQTCPVIAPVRSGPSLFFAAWRDLKEEGSVTSSITELDEDSTVLHWEATKAPQGQHFY